MISILRATLTVQSQYTGLTQDAAHLWDIPRENTYSSRTIKGRRGTMTELDNMSKSKICSFYKDKNIFITGATGFVGKLLAEKLLRLCQPKALYFLIRPKKNVDPQVRLTEIFQSPIFEKMKASVPDYMNRVNLVAGDVSQPGLGLADSDRLVLVNTINIVFHGAATIKFDEHLSLATAINVRGTKAVLELCREMTKLEAVVHVSTAFCNCPRKDIEEEFYEAPLSADSLIKLTECLKESQVAKIAPCVMDNWPNTYAFTKALAEDVIKNHSKGLPISIFRPAIIVSTLEEPVPGWIDNLYGPTGLMVGYGAGIIRVMRYQDDCDADIVPADMSVNCLLAIGYKTGVCPPALNVPIYNYTTHKDNKLKWKDFVESCAVRGKAFPAAQTVWYYTKIHVKNLYMFMFLCFLFHTIPALLVDIVLVALNKQPKALKVYKKIHKFSDVISYFSLRSWNFANDNVNSLWKTLGDSDQALFNFDMSTLDWNKFFISTVDGLRLYMFKETLDNVEYARKRFFVLRMLHHTVQVIFYGGLAWSLWHLSWAVKNVLT